MVLLDVAGVRRGLVSTIVGSRFLYHVSVSSTMDVAREAASVGSPEGTVVVAEEQTSGRGRLQRQWISPPGSNLYFSVLLYPTLPVFRRLTMATSLGVAKGITRACGLPVTIKWPNDILRNGKKMCGLLLEGAVEPGQVEYAIVGIGLNVNFDPSTYPAIAPTATSLMTETGQSIAREHVLMSILQEIDSIYLFLKSGGDLRNEWRSCLETLGKWVEVQWGEQREEGLAEDVNEEGELILRRRDGSRVTLSAGDVTLQV